jgi:hypothetical protein
MAFRGGWLSSASAVLRGASSNLAAAQTSVSTGQSFHSTAACLKQKFFGTVISDAMNKSGKRSAAPRLCTLTLSQFCSSNSPSRPATSVSTCGPRPGGSTSGKIGRGRWGC